MGNCYPRSTTNTSTRSRSRQNKDSGSFRRASLPDADYSDQYEMQCFDKSCVLHHNPPDESSELYVKDRVLPSLPRSSPASRHRQSLRYQEISSPIPSRSESTPDCGTSPAATNSRLDEAAADYASAWDRRPTTSQNLTPLQAPSYSSCDIYNDPETPISRSSTSLVHSRSHYAPISLQAYSLCHNAPINFQTRQSTPSSNGTNYIRNFNFVNNPVTRLVTKEVKQFEDTAVEPILHKLDDGQGFVEDSRQFVDIPVDAGVIYQWKFMIVSSSGIAAENEYIRLVYSTNPQDRPTSLPDTFVLLYDGVIHCLPHNHTFNEPIRLSFILPNSINLRQITVMYSNTDVGDATRWTAMGKPKHSLASASWHNRESSSHQNQAILLTDRRQLQLVLRHFCIFAIMVDGQEEQAQNVFVETFLKISVNSFRYTVNILVVVGCDTNRCNERKEMALGDGFRGVEKTELIVFENGEDLTVKVANVRWMNDSVLQHPASFTHDMHSVWRGIARPNSFEVTSEAAVRHGVDSSFSFDVHIQQSDLESLVFHISQDLHELLPTRSPMTGVLAHCACHRCRAALSRRHVSTERVHEPSARRPAPTESPPSPCPSDSAEDNPSQPRVQLRSDGSSSPTSLCCDYDYHQVRLDDGVASAARPMSNRPTSEDFVAETDGKFHWSERTHSPVTDMKNV